MVPQLPTQSIANLQPLKTDRPVRGLTIVPEFITPEQQQQLISHLTKQQWNNALKRRTQHYGYEYSYDRKSVAVKTHPIPHWCEQVKHKIQKSISSVDRTLEFDQMIINEYEPGQGINPHIDSVNLFTDVVVSVSLASDCVMVFESQQKEESEHKEDKVQIRLDRRSMMVMEGEARYKWKHSIPSRKKDNGVKRGVRYSLTFRKMNEMK